MTTKTKVSQAVAILKKVVVVVRATGKSTQADWQGAEWRPFPTVFSVASLL